MIKYFEEQTFENSDFTSEELLNGEYEYCTFVNCNFSSVNLSEFEFGECEFVRCDFSNAILKNTALRKVKFDACKLIGLQFDECKDFLFEVEFVGCQLNYSSFFERKMKATFFSKCTLADVDFSSTDLSKSKFIECDLSGASFDQTNLTEVDFSSADNYIIDPDSNSIKKAKFSKEGLPGLLKKYQIKIV